MDYSQLFCRIGLKQLVVIFKVIYALTFLSTKLVKNIQQWPSFIAFPEYIYLSLINYSLFYFASFLRLVRSALAN